MMKIFILFVITISSGLTAQAIDTLDQSNPPPENSNNIFSHDGRHLINTAVSIGKAPFEWQSNDWQKAGIYLGATGISMTVDLSIKKYSQENQSADLDNFFQIDDYYGTGSMLILSGGLYLGGILGESNKIRILGLKTFEAFIYSGLIANVIKPILGRQRPYAGDDNLVFQPFTLDNQYHALPSGHTTVSFAVSTVMAKEVDNLFWDAFWYGIAGWTSAARIYHNQHWFSDTVAGGLLGYTVGTFITDLGGPEEPNAQTFKAYLTPGGIGVRYYLY